MNNHYNKHGMGMLALALMSGMAWGAGPLPGQPGAGTLLQEVQPAPVQEPSGNATGLTIEAGKRKKGLDDSVAFDVKQIVFEGNRVVDTATLHDLVRDEEGTMLTLKKLQGLADRVTGYYRDHGYPLSRAVIPVQSLEGGVVRIQVIEAKYGKVLLDNTSRAKSWALQKLLYPLKGGEAVQEGDLDRALLLMSDVPGVESSAALKPGDQVGTSDLDVMVKPGAWASGSLTADNYGNDYTGNGRLGGAVSVYELLGLGDQLSANALTSGPGMNYGRVGYDLLANGSGTRVGASLSDLRYVLGGSLAGLNGSGTAAITSLWARQPLLRSRSVNLYGQAEYDYKRVSDQTDPGGVLNLTNRHLDNGMLSLNGDERDGWMRGGVGLMSASWTQGRVNFDNMAALSVDTAGARESGTFGKWNGSLTRLQDVGSDRAQLYLSVSGQWAQKNLDPVEKLVVGGPYSVRAYDMGVLAADSGVLETVEGRYKVNDHWQAVVFGDRENVSINANPYLAGPNGATLSGAGLGLNWSGDGAWNGRTYVATRVGAVPTQLAGSPASTLIWAELSRTF